MCECSQPCVCPQDTLKDFLERKEKGELTVQKTGYLKQNILREVRLYVKKNPSEPLMVCVQTPTRVFMFVQVNLSVSRGGSVCFGDVVMLVNVGGSNRDHCAISINADITSLGKGPSAAIQSPCGVSGGKSLQPCTRIAFVIHRYSIHTHTERERTRKRDKLTQVVFDAVLCV